MTTNGANTDIVQTEIQQWMKKCQTLEKENGEQKRKMLVYEESLKKLLRIVADGGVGTDFKQIKKNASAEIQAALTTVQCYINGCVWYRVKMLPNDWVKWKEAPRSVCQSLIRRVRTLIPSWWMDEVFWHVYLVPTTRSIYINNRTNTTATLKLIFKGKTSVLCDIVRFMNTLTYY